MIRTMYSRSVHAGVVLVLVSVAMTVLAVVPQQVAWENDCTYQDSIDARRLDRPGIHMLRATDVAWPAGTEQFMIKIWLSGLAGSTATLDRMLLVRAEPGPGTR